MYTYSPPPIYYQKHNTEYPVVNGELGPISGPFLWTIHFMSHICNQAHLFCKNIFHRVPMISGNYKKKQEKNNVEEKSRIFIFHIFYLKNLRK